MIITYLKTNLQREIDIFRQYLVIYFNIYVINFPKRYFPDITTSPQQINHFDMSPPMLNR